MNDQENTLSPSLWQTRDALPRLPIPAALLLLACTAVSSGVCCLSTWLLPGMIVSAAAFTVLLLLFRHPAQWTALPLAYLIALAVWRSPLGALSALCFVPLAAVLTVCLYRRRKCSRAILWLSLAGLLTALAFCAAALASHYGSVIGGFRQFLDAVSVFLRTQIEAAAADASLPAAVREPLGDYLEHFDELLRSLYALLPGLLGCAVLVCSWLLCKLTQLLLRAFRADKLILRKAWNVTVPFFWALAYLIASLLSLPLAFLPGTVAAVPNMICTNLLLVLQPGVFAVGFRRAVLAMRKLRRAGATLPYAGAILLLVVLFGFSGTFMLLLFSMFGSFRVIRLHRRKNGVPPPPGDVPPAV